MSSSPRSAAAGTAAGETRSQKEQDLSIFLDLLKQKETSLPVAAITVLIAAIKRSTATTMMGLQQELRDVEHTLLEFVADRSHMLHDKTTISLSSGCELFLRYVTRCSLDIPEFDACKQLIFERGKQFQETSVRSRQKIAQSSHSFVRDGAVVMTYSWSRVVEALLLEASKTKHFSVIIPEGGGEGVAAAKALAATGIPVSVILDTSVAFHMAQADICIVGAEGVVENGGIVNKIGTYQLAIVAKALSKPFYVAAESYKFARLYPLSQRDLPFSRNPGTELEEELSKIANISVENPAVDYTPAEYISLLFTDLGVLTPSAVSDELIRLYQ